MQQRRAVSGRPTGTDGSDFSYRMVVDSRYTKVARGKTHLRNLLVLQAVSYALGCLLVFILGSKVETGIKNFVFISNAVGFLSVLIGELGRRWSQKVLLRFFLIVSSIATALSVVCLVRSNLFIKAIQQLDISSITSYELVEGGRVSLGIILQIVAIIITVALVQNMSPRRAS